MIKDAPEHLAEVLSLRQQLAKSSVKKYTAMKNAVCIDNRARGMFQFYGANRTGRFAGRLVQLQNLPQNHMPDLTQARDILMYAMQTLRNCNIVAHVHDEVIIECRKDMSLDAVCEQMGRTPPWAKGLLLRADGYECQFYKKD